MTIIAVKAVGIKYSERVSLALVIRNTMRMRHTMLPSVAYMVVPHFSTYLINGTL